MEGEGAGGWLEEEARMAAVPVSAQGRGWRDRKKAASQGLDSPAPWAPARQTRPAGTRQLGHDPPKPPGPPPAPPVAPAQPTHLLAFLSPEAGHPRVALQMKHSESAHLRTPTGRRRRRLGPGEGEALVLTTLPRGPVFPGEPCSKPGVRD